MTSSLPHTGHVLIVDDTPENVMLYRAQLERVRHRVTTANSGAAALEAVSHERPDLILLDILMPGMDGYEVCRRLKANAATQPIPVIVLTALNEQTDKVRALEAGADDFLSKPVDRAELLARVRSHLRSKFLYDELRRSRDEIRSLNGVLEQRVAERTRQLQEALATLREAQAHVVQQERLRALGEMASGVAHDLNNALAPVVGFSELLLEDPTTLSDPKRVLGHLRLINDVALSAAAVVGRLRQFYRPREGEDQLEPVSLPAVVQQTIALTQPKWRDQALVAGKTIRIETDLQDVPDVAGAENELRDLLTNLVFNAVDAIPPRVQGGVIALRTRVAEDEVLLEVQDTGTGMTDEVRRRCLEPFFTTKGENGTGLGLSSVHGILRRHGGALEIESEVGEGTTFRIRLPVYGQGVPPIAELDGGDPVGVLAAEAESSSVSEVASGATARHGLRVLVVDDEPLIRQVVAAFVASDGHEVLEMTTAAEALDALGRESVDLVLADWAMPGMGGDQLAAAAKQQAPHVPIVLVTGFGDLANASGESIPFVDAIVGKPVTLEKLRAALTRVLPDYRAEKVRTA